MINLIFLIGLNNYLEILHIYIIDTISFLDKLCLKINSDKGLYYYNNSNIEEKIQDIITQKYMKKFLKNLEINLLNY